MDKRHFTVVIEREGEDPRFVLNQNPEIYEIFDSFVSQQFLNRQHRDNFDYIKSKIIIKIKTHFTRLKKKINTEKTRYNIFYIFYIYNASDNQIVSIGVMGGPNNKYHGYKGRTVINSKEYLYIHLLLSRVKKGGTSAIYHILSSIPDKYAGICLYPARDTAYFYELLGFTGFIGTNKKYLFQDLLILDKTPENIHKLEEKLPHPIITEFHSNYPDNQII